MAIFHGLHNFEVELMLPNIADVGRASDWKGVVLRQSKMHSMTYAFSLLLFLQSYQITGENTSSDANRTI